MVYHTVLTALVCGAAIYAYQFVRGMYGATATAPEALPKPIATTPKVPSMADSFEAVAIVRARLVAVGCTPDEITAMTQPLILALSREVKA